MNLLWAEKIKTKLVDVVKEHLVSIAIFFLATFIEAVLGSDYHKDYVLGTMLPFIRDFLFSLTPGILLCESYYLYKREIDKRGKIFIMITAVISILISFWYTSLNTLFEKMLKKSMDGAGQFTSTSFDFEICYIVAALGLAVYFIYKRSGERFEAYCAKAFCGLMKALLIYGIIALGVLMVLLIFNVLIIDTSSIELIYRLEIMLTGLVAFPCALMGICKTEGVLSKFSKIVISYIFTVLLAIAFLIIYIYIFKIIFTWQFPKNQVFSILTALFSFGIVIWTMAAGSCDEKFTTPIKLMPFVFIPFIVLQIMCLYMRVADYGFTRSRYFGMALIVFEVLYFVMYAFYFFTGKEITYSLIFMIIAGTFLSLIVPFTNYKSVIVMSQKSKIEEYFAQAEADKGTKKAAYEAYKTIWREGGYQGSRYIDNHFSKEQIEELKDGSDINTDSSSDYFYINVRNDIESLNIEGYKEIYFVDLYNSGEDTGHVSITTVEGKEVGVADLSDITSEIMELDKNGINNDDEKREVISHKLNISPEGELIITYFNLSGDYNNITPIDSMNIEGYVLIR